MDELKYFVYQVYPKSFKDTTGNGVGDINGIIEKLPYIKDLGFDYVWLTPMYVSPQKDNGYDVADYYKIDPLFGTMDDFKRLISQAEAIGLKIMMDMVFNHTSDQHEWFQRALKGEKRYQDYYIFRDTKEQTTTWESKFGGSTWEYVESLNKYYLHLFDKSQPDLNWENKELRKEIYKVVNFWLTQGVKGFRFDVINLISKKYPLVNGKGDGRDQYTDGPRNHEFLKELRKNTFANKDNILTVGEMSSTSIESCLKYAAPKREELDTVFHFHHLKVDYEDGQKWTKDYFDFQMLKDLTKKWQISMDEHKVVDTLFWSNHDQPRIASRFIQATNKEHQLLKNKTLALLMYLQKGICYIFQGEEIGMENLNVKNINQLVDVESLNFYNSSPLNEVDKRKILSQKSRDNGRTPMQWDNSINGGFSKDSPWILANEKYKEINVQAQLNNKNSTLNFYKYLINLKKNNNTFINGKIEFIEHKDLFIYIRKDNENKYLVICNLFNKSINYLAKPKEVLINNGCKVEEENIVINPFSSILVKL